MTDDASFDKSRLALLWLSWRRRRLCEENVVVVVVVVVVRASIIVVIVFEEASSILRTILIPKICIDDGGDVFLCEKKYIAHFFSSFLVQHGLGFRV